MQPLVTLATARPLPSQSEPPGFLPAATGSGSTTGEDVSGRAGVIAGTIIGGVAFIALTLLACFFCFRRRRQKSRSRQQKQRSHMREESWASWNANSLMGSVKVLKYRQFSHPGYVDAESPPGPGPPAQHRAQDESAGGRPLSYQQSSRVRRHVSSRRYSNLDASYSFSPEMSGANNDMSYSDGNPFSNSAHPHRVSQVSSRWAPSTVSDPFTDDESPVSPILELNTPSRTLSCYSRPSHQGGLNILARSDGSARDSQFTTTYSLPGQLTRESTDPLPTAPPPSDGISRTGSAVHGRSHNPSSSLAQFARQISDSWHLEQPPQAALRSDPCGSPPPRGGLF
jgi:hypothetical protein